MTVTHHVTRNQRRDSRRTFDRYTEPTLTDPSVKHSTSLRSAADNLETLKQATGNLFRLPPMEEAS